MGHRKTAWIQRLIFSGTVIAGMVVGRFGFGIVKTLAIILAICSVMALSLIAVSPGPRAKEFVEGLRNRLR